MTRTVRTSSLSTPWPLLIAPDSRNMPARSCLAVLLLLVPRVALAGWSFCPAGSNTPCSDANQASASSALSPGRVWDGNRSYTLLGYAQASYCRVVEGNFTACGEVCRGLPLLSNFSVITGAGMRGGLAFVGFDAAAQHIVVSFRGTQATNFRNWWSDLSSMKLVAMPSYMQCDATKTRPQRCEGCQLGAGFVEAYDALRAGVLDAVLFLRREHPDAPAVVVGHSLGAALASLHAMDLAARGVPLAAAVTFGSPRTGNKNFSAYYATHVEGQGVMVETGTGTRSSDSASGSRDGASSSVYAWRVTHYRDPIVHLAARVQGLWHVPGEIFFTQATGLEHRLCDGSGEDPSCSYGTTPLPSTRDHLHYMDKRLGSYACP